MHGGSSLKVFYCFEKLNLSCYLSFVSLSRYRKKSIFFVWQYKLSEKSKNNLEFLNAKKNVNKNGLKSE